MSAVDEKSFKVFNDPIHGHIALHPLCVDIIDTPQFQRLRNLKQLGGCYYVYPGASHNRFEHSIGVCHLAGELVTHLQKSQSGLDINDKDVLCVKIAGLCHDLGHGPFSHLFDQQFIPGICKQHEAEQKNSSHEKAVQGESSQGESAREKTAHEKRKDWKHEKASVDMFNFMLEDNNNKLYKRFTESYETKLSDEDIEFIRNMIRSEEERTMSRGGKEFLFQIVANELNSIDVDKWDYFARDSFYLGIAMNFDFRRYLKLTRVIEHEGKLQICIRDKEASSVYDMFQSRMSLHWRAYQHKTNKIIEYMISEAMVLADEYIRVKVDDKTKKALQSAGVKVDDKNKIKMSDAIFSPEAYMKLDDSVFQKILHSTKIKSAQEILLRIINRDLYKFIEEIQLSKSVLKLEVWEESLKKELIDYYDGCSNKPDKVLNPDDIVVMVANFDYGKKEGDACSLDSPCNPVNHVKIYRKSAPTDAESIDSKKLEIMLPRRFRHKVCRVYYKSHEPEVWKTLEKVITDHHEELKKFIKRQCQEANQRMSQDNLPVSEHSGINT